MVSFYKTLGAVCEDLRVFFKLSFIPHLGLGRKVVPVYLINPVPKTKVPAAVASVLTQNVWVTVLDAVGSVCVDTIMFQQEVAGETLEVRITDDAGSETKSQVAVAGTVYYIVRDGAGASNSLRYGIETTAYMLYGAGLKLCGRSFKVEIRKTTAAGANNTNCKVLYCDW